MPYLLQSFEGRAQLTIRHSSFFQTQAFESGTMRCEVRIEQCIDQFSLLPISAQEQAQFIDEPYTRGAHFA
jgi:hypothetical protein